MGNIGYKTMIVLVGFLFFPIANTSYGQTLELLLGQKVKMNGVIAQRDPGSFVLRDSHHRDVVVIIDDETEIREKKSNIFRRARHYESEELARGLNVEVEGRGDDHGRLVAKKIRFTHSEFRIASAVESRVKPVEGRLSETEDRLAQNEANAEHLSGQLDELSTLSDSALKDARSAQETADSAIAGLKEVNRLIADNNTETNERISALDDYEPKSSAIVYFKAGSAALSDDAKETLRQIAAETRNEKGFIIEVTGFASSDGSEAFNKILSQRRASAVVDYLAGEEMIPLRRIINPYGFGEKLPSADNTTRAGREQNRRVEIKVLVSRGLIDRAGISTTAQN